MSGGGFVHLNRDGVWLGFERRGVDVVDGRLQLAALPALGGSSPVEVDGPAPTAPAGLAVAADGRTFFTDQTAARVVVEECDGVRRRIACIGGTGSDLTQLSSPGGIAVHPGRGALLVADTANHRVQLFDLRSFQLLDVWGDAGAGRPPEPSDAPGRLDSPADVAVDAEGRVYVADQGNGRVQQFDARGEVIRGFAERLADEGSLVDPVAVAAVPGRGGTAVYILDRAGPHLVRVDETGHVHGRHPLDVRDPLGLAVTDDAVYVGDNGARAVVALRRDGRLVGVARGYSGPVAALALDGAGGLLVHPGGQGPPVRLVLGAAFAAQGIAWGGPFGGFSGLPKAWQRLVADADPLPTGAHARLFVHVADDPTTGPPVDATGPNPFDDAAWSAGPADLTQFLVRRPPATYAWVGVQLSSEGAGTPAIGQLRLEFDRPGYVAHLPAIYRAEDPDAFLPRFLALAESLFGEVEAENAGLSRTLDPAGAPKPFLDALARWLAVDVTARWDEPELRDAVSAAYVESATRGTAAGLRAAMRRSTGIDAWIEEPIATSAWWALAGGESSPDAERETSLLGFTTMLAGAEPQGAVLGSTATVDRSHLIGSDEYGTPLFDSVAHRFAVRLYQGGNYSAERVAAVETLLDRERPAHTEYVICRVDPGLAVGLGRIGIDTVLAGEAGPVRLDGEAVLDGGFVLGGDPPGRVGGPGGVGVGTRLGSGSVRD